MLCVVTPVYIYMGPFRGQNTSTFPFKHAGMVLAVEYQDSVCIHCVKHCVVCVCCKCVVAFCLQKPLRQGVLQSADSAGQEVLNASGKSI